MTSSRRPASPPAARAAASPLSCKGRGSRTAVPDGTCPVCIRNDVTCQHGAAGVDRGNTRSTQERQQYSRELTNRCTKLELSTVETWSEVAKYIGRPMPRTWHKRKKQ